MLNFVSFAYFESMLPFVCRFRYQHKSFYFLEPFCTFKSVGRRIDLEFPVSSFQAVTNKQTSKQMDASWSKTAFENRNRIHSSRSNRFGGHFSSLVEPNECYNTFWARFPLKLQHIFSIKWANPGLFFVYFWSFFKKNNTNFTTNQCKTMSIQYLALSFDPMNSQTWVVTQNH